MSKLYGQPDLIKLLPVIAFTALIGGFNSTSLFTLSRNIKLKRLTILDISTQIVSIVVMVTWGSL